MRACSELPVVDNLKSLIPDFLRIIFVYIFFIRIFEFYLFI